jgi:adenine phosphoribosyltransferase
LIIELQPEEQLPMNELELKKLIREIPDFPKPGILFYDITTLLKDAAGLRAVIDQMAEHYSGKNIDTVIGVEARGFIFAPTLAYLLGAGFVPVRKPKKLPSEVESHSYDLEYGKDTLEIHKDAVGDGSNVIVADDLLATGGTAEAVVKLVEKLGGKVVGLSFMIELEFLNGRERLAGHDVFSLLKYQS